VVAVGPIGVLDGAKVAGTVVTGMVTVPGVGTTIVDEPMTKVVGDGQ